MAAVIRIVLGTVIMLAFFPLAHAEGTSENYQEWLANLEADALADGIPKSVVHGALDAVEPDDRVRLLDQKQPEKTLTFEDYSEHIVAQDRVRAGQKALFDNNELLTAASREYGVPPEIIVALWGIESNYGHNSGSYNVISSLVTLAYEGRRADFFRTELLAALHVLDQEHISAEDLKGSWAGAMGQCQFMPSTFLRYAADGDHDGIRDIWANTGDVIASIANYIAAEGWKPGLPWGQEVMLDKPLMPDDVGLTHTLTVAEWGERGIHLPENLPPELLAQPASLIQPDGQDGRSFLVYDNFRALMRWNRSTYFAISVGLLADRIRL